MKVVNLSDSSEIVNELSVADTFWKRFKGLMFKRGLNSGYGLHIKPCQSVHTFFMKFNIDVIYVNDKLEVVGLDKGLTPNRVGKVRKNAQSVIEVSAGTVEQTGIQIGNQLLIKN
ncbi:DUF192 domain-containing protein [Alkalibacillus aidingensis]|uniref:DUF192 domain-containing protein n=1 Tax=Alkalibacillus aidingensis TaxID=2747607 RepID=UPI0016614F22|nr:DUF192 domain-containing protein [Alkalibacillus aidingensis]